MRACIGWSGFCELGPGDMSFGCVDRAGIMHACMHASNQIQYSKKITENNNFIRYSGAN